jgi:hypothetical protein
LSFTITGSNETACLGNITIPKTAVSYGTNPIVYINGQQASNQGYTQDALNFYVWYITKFDTNLINGVSQMTVQFVEPSTPVSSLGVVLAVLAAGEIMLIFTVIAVRRLRQKLYNA